MFQRVLASLPSLPPNIILCKWSTDFQRSPTREGEQSWMETTEATLFTSRQKTDPMTEWRLFLQLFMGLVLIGTGGIFSLLFECFGWCKVCRYYSWLVNPFSLAKKDLYQVKTLIKQKQEIVAQSKCRKEAVMWVKIRKLEVKLWH